MNLDRVTSGRDVPNDFNVIVEIPRKRGQDPFPPAEKGPDRFSRYGLCSFSSST